MREAVKNLALISQLGLSLMMPLLLMLFLCNFFVEKYSLPSWIYLPGLLFGLGGSGMTAYKFYLAFGKEGEKRKRDKHSSSTHRW